MASETENFHTFTENISERRINSDFDQRLMLISEERDIATSLYKSNVDINTELLRKITAHHRQINLALRDVNIQLSSLNASLAEQIRNIRS